MLLNIQQAGLWNRPGGANGDFRTLWDLALEVDVGGVTYLVGYQRGSAAPLFVPIETTGAGLSFAVGGGTGVRRVGRGLKRKKEAQCWWVRPLHGSHIDDMLIRLRTTLNIDDTFMRRLRQEAALPPLDQESPVRSAARLPNLRNCEARMVPPRA